MIFLGRSSKDVEKKSIFTNLTGVVSLISNSVTLSLKTPTYVNSLPSLLTLTFPKRDVLP